MRSVVISNSFNPYYNIAVETCLMDWAKPDDEIMFLWQNDKTVVCGRNQNPLKECDIERLNADGGHVARRYSGGGAVYHDLGNLNFTFITAYREDQMKKNTDFIIGVLELFGIEAVFSGRNDILVDGRKVSGGAFFEEGGKLCHHGTMLVHSNIDDLEKYLQPSILKLKSKGIDSIRSRVLNLQEVNEGITTLALTDALVSAFDPDEPLHIAEEVLPMEHKRVAPEMDKLKSWNWIQGESPAYNVNFIERFSWGELDLKCFVENGHIKEVSVHTDALALEVTETINKALVGRRFSAHEVRNTFGELLQPWAKEVGIWLSGMLPTV